MLYAEALTRRFGALEVIREASFTLGDGEHAGLVGPNGAGKSTLLRLLSGEDQPDGGSAGRRGGSLGYLRQDGDLGDDRPLVDELWTAFGDVVAVQRQVEAVSSRIERDDGDIDALIAEQARLFERFESLDGYRIDRRIGRVLDGLGFSQPDRLKRCGEFSGGWQMRIALAKVLVRRPDHMLLDEPTNHLDTAAREWLEQDLRDFKGTLLVVTHDGDFLDAVVERVLELRDGVVNSYTGGYTQYQRQKAEQIAQQERAASRQERELDKQQRFVDRFRATATRATQAASRERAIARVERIDRPQVAREVNFRLRSSGRPEREVLTVRHVGHTWGDQLALIDANLMVERGQRVVLVGPNGSGKSTLLRAVAGEFEPTEGRIEWSERAQPAYYDQHQDKVLDPARTVLEEVRSVADGESDGALRATLGQFLFSGDDVFRPVAVLSGGERSRVALAKFLVQPSNVLLLDEPTNHLDVATRRKLVDALEAYDGTVLCASHDPAILERVATRVFEVKDGECVELDGRAAARFGERA